MSVKDAKKLLEKSAVSGDLRELLELIVKEVFK